MEEIKVRELPDKNLINTTDFMIVEDEDGTKKVPVKHFRSLVLNTLYFNNIEELKTNTAMGLKEGDICQTLGYYVPGDGGGAKYAITYNPGAVQDGKLIHNLSYSDTLRAEIILEDKINVAQFGAKGDGIADDTDAIQATIDNSECKTIEFVKDRNYVIKDTINISKNCTIINGNGATIYPHYCDGLHIYNENGVSAITIKNLDFNCQLATSAIKTSNAENITITNSNITNISNKGIHLKKSLFINIDKCKLDGLNNSSLITLEGENDNDGLSTSRAINITNCKFNDFLKAINVLGTGSVNSDINTLINLDNCYYHSTVNNCYCIYLSSPIEMMRIDNNSVFNASTFLYFGGVSSGKISCSDLDCISINKVFDIISNTGTLHLKGALNVSNSTAIFANMAGKLHSNILWNDISIGANFSSLPTGELFDTVYPYQYNESGYSISNSTLTLREIRNLNVDWNSSTSNINTIANGIKGQLIYIKSSTNKSIVAVANKVVLAASSVQLGPYKGVILKYDGLKWIQTTDVINDSMIEYTLGDIESQFNLKLANAESTLSNKIDSVETELDAKINSLSTSTNNELGDIKNTLQTQESTINSIRSDYNNKIQTLTVNTENNLNTITVDYNAKINSLTTNVNNELDDIKNTLQTQQSTINNVKNDIQNQFDVISKDYTSKISELDEKLGQQIDGVKSDYTSKISALDTKLGQQISGVKSDYASKISALDTKLGQQITNIQSEISTINNDINKIKSHVGMIIHSTTLNTMAKVIAIYGGTTWVKIEGRFLLGQSSSYGINSTGGEATHTLTVSELPEHFHTNNSKTMIYRGSNSGSLTLQHGYGETHSNFNYNDSTGITGEGEAHNNMPPYKVVYIWERTA